MLQVESEIQEIVGYQPAITKGWIVTVEACIALQVNKSNVSIKILMMQARIIKFRLVIC